MASSGNSPTTFMSTLENDICILMRDIAEYRVRRQTYRWTRGVEPDDMLNSYIFGNKKKMMKEQGKVLDALKKSIAKRVFVLRKMKKVVIPSYSRWFGLKSST